MPRFPATAAVGDSGRIREYPITAAEDWRTGAAVVLAGAPARLVECGADPASILGFAQARVTAGDLFGEMAGLGLGCPVAIAQEGRKYWMAGDNDPVDTDRGLNFGIAVDADGIWYVDGTDVVNTRVHVNDVDLERKLYLVSVLAANRQIAP